MRRGPKVKQPAIIEFDRSLHAKRSVGMARRTRRLEAKGWCLRSRAQTIWRRPL